MPEINPPFTMQGRSDNSAYMLRAALASMLTTWGIVDSTSLVVSQRALGANLSVDITQGGIWTEGLWTPHGRYYFENDGPYNFAWPNAPDATYDFIDSIGVQIRDADFSGAFSDGHFVVLHGTPAASPVAPGWPDQFSPIANVRIRKAPNTQILNSDITCDETIRPTIKARGQPIVSFMSQQAGVQSGFEPSVTTNGSGVGTITYGATAGPSSAFPVKTISAIASTPDAGASNDRMLYPTATQSRTALTFVATRNGALDAGATFGVWWQALGN